ncbi:MAG: primosomal protein N' [Melioribacteraceae bacterium]|nr:MAG: primosomal protein N' [Melioribacteraceae bacterium]
MYAQVVFPQSFRNSFTYLIPKELRAEVEIGKRVVVPFGRRVLTGFVIDLTENTEIKEKIKPIRDVLDDKPIFDKKSLKFYEWIAEYYLSSLGEALRNSVPYGSDVESKRRIVAEVELCKKLYDYEKKKSTIKAKLLFELAQKESHSISQLQKAVKKKNIYSILNSLQANGVVTILDLIDDAKVKVRKVKFVKLAKSKDEIYEFLPEIESRSPKQVVILLDLLSRKDEEVQQSELIEKTKTSHSSIRSLEQKRLIEVFEKEVERTYEELYTEKIKNFSLTEKQKEIIEIVTKNIKKNKFDSYLLHGVTGSGKTQIYIDLAKEALKKKKTVLVLVPEISLTPQITSRFFNTFGDKVAVMHSRMSLGQRYDTWRGIIAEKYSIVIGPRSALFAPLKNLGLVVVDEEHDSSYKQFEMVPKYHARDAAIIKAMFNDCPVLLGSATPSIESMYNAKQGKYKLVELLYRIDNAKMPEIKLVDISAAKKQKKLEGSFSSDLLSAINQKLKKNERVIILQNRRGFSTQVFCEDCGNIEMCDDCSVPNVYHISKNIMQCHYCGNVKPVPKACSVCGSIKIKFFGTGTQRVEDEIDYYFPDAKIERIDSDSINKKGKLSSILNSFKKGEIDILVGTQMVSKGLDFSDVTLVGVISAETTLWIPDFRADERTFQLLTQVAGRAGRSSAPGQVLIQTANKSNFVLQKVLQTDYEGFYEKEIGLRKQGDYPPFTRLCLIETKDGNDPRSKNAIKQFYDILQKKSKGLMITPPQEAIIHKLKGEYRYHLLIKSKRETDPNGRILREAVLNTFIEFNRVSRFRDVKLIIDIDPQGML